MKLELSKEEAQQLVLLIDLAVKANGIRVAETAIVLVKKLEAASVAEENESAIEAGN